MSDVLLGLPLWIAGVHFFDGVHWLLHLMLGSRWRPLRLLAAPHAMHHHWLDPELRTRWEYQRRNIWGHIVLEYVTQLVFSAALLLFLPSGVVLSCVAYQTLLFAYILSQQGLDVAHREIQMLDAYRPSFLALPAYHALHHAYPDAYFSAYTKLVDYLVGGGTYLQRRVAMLGADSPFGLALRECLARAGVASLQELDDAEAASLASTDILVICDPAADTVALVERFIAATRERQLPPEVWATQTDTEAGVARHYYLDRRVNYRAIVLDAAAQGDPAAAGRAARRALFWIRRGLNYVPTSGLLAGLQHFRRFRRAKAQRPPHVDPRKRRIDLLEAS